MSVQEYKHLTLFSATVQTTFSDEGGPVRRYRKLEVMLPFGELRVDLTRPRSLAHFRWLFSWQYWPRERDTEYLERVWRDQKKRLKSRA